ncbi:MAG: carbohydrate ABC transporter permease [Lachnospiraceae bacterium]|nr:carbohydrate ABC transporter permease [Lachnospiraceae bacterium]
MVLASFKKMVDLLNVDKMFAFTPTIQNYIDVFSKYDFWQPLQNSMLIAVLSTMLALLFGLPASYVIAREKMSGFSAVILVIRIIPAISFLVPWYILFNRLRLTGTYTSLVLVHLLVALPMIVWIMIPFFETMPRELEEASWMDGCSHMGTFVKILLPLASPAVLTATILSFIFSWNNFIFALILCTNDTRTLPTAVFQFMSYTDVDWACLMAAAVIITIPILLISVFLQKYIITGMTAGAVKG